MQMRHKVWSVVLLLEMLGALLVPAMAQKIDAPRVPAAEDAQVHTVRLGLEGGMTYMDPEDINEAKCV